MEEKQEKKSARGGRRDGAGRKRKTAHTYALYATQEVHDILQSVEGSKSDFICKCVLAYAKGDVS